MADTAGSSVSAAGIDQGPRALVDQSPLVVGEQGADALLTGRRRGDQVFGRSAVREIDSTRRSPAQSSSTLSSGLRVPSLISVVASHESVSCDRRGPELDGDVVLAPRLLARPQDQVLIQQGRTRAEPGRDVLDEEDLPRRDIRQVEGLHRLGRLVAVQADLHFDAVESRRSPWSGDDAVPATR